MDKLRIFVGDQLAGHLSRSGHTHRFEYLPEYAGPPAFLGWNTARKHREWDAFPPAFDGLLPEGVLLDQLLAKYKLDRADKWRQLVAVGQDLTGFISVLPEDTGEPISKIAPGTPPQKRVPIYPPENGLPYTTTALVAYYGRNRLKMSISGIQPKVSAIYSRTESCFKVVELNGSYILKPSPQAFPSAAENEALTMQLAKAAGIEVPHCGWLRAKDGQGVFWIERFDRWGVGNRNRVRCEDACQILEVPSSWKYAGNLETLARMIREHCSNPRLQLVKLFQRVLFCWVTGNGDMHLKNWSLIERGPLIELSPAYDLLNTKILIDDEDESAIALNERNSGFDRQLLVDYFGRDICGINERMINKTIQQLAKVDWNSAIRNSHVSDEDRVAYSQLVDERLNCLAHMGN
jgi:serine/threonine-protein kinase HipA